MRALPDLDIGPFLCDPASPAAAAFAHRLREACREPGFCYLRGHGVPAELDDAVMAVAREFFALPEAERRALEIVNSPHFRGYTVLGDERTRGISDWREQLDVGPEEPPWPLRAGDPPWLKLRGPNQWPTGLPRMRGVVLRWMAAMGELGLALLRALALGLGQPPGYFDAVMLPRGDPHVKIIRYPPQRPGADTGQGVGTHQDSGLLTLILQSQVGGLQVLANGEPIAAAPRPGAYVLNLGEMMQAATNGYLSATRHRVASPPDGRERISIAYFAHPKLEASFPPIPLPPELAAAARDSPQVDPNDPIFATFGANCLKIRLRSHPDVARAHYGREPGPAEPA